MSPKGYATVAAVTPEKEDGKTQTKDDLPNDGPMIQAAKEGITAFGLQFRELLPEKGGDGRHLLSFCPNPFCQFQNHAAVFMIWEENEMFSFYLRAPARIPPPQQTRVVLFLNYVNGKIRGKSWIDVHSYFASVTINRILPMFLYCLLRGSFPLGS